MLIENTGNVPVSPSEVNFRIYDPTGTVLLEETTHTNKFPKIDPFATDNLVAELPTRLPPGSYLARYEIMNGDTLKQEGELTLNIAPYGTLQTAGYGFLGLSLPHKISVILPVVSILFIIGSVIYTQRQRFRGRTRSL